MLGIGGDVGLRFRVDDFSRRERSSARDTYNARVKRSGFQVREALQDSMLSLKALMQSIAGKGTKGKGEVSVAC